MSETYMDYPKEVKQQSGCKVGWLYYKDKKSAQLCSKAAKNNANLRAWQGYDFGFCVPGEIERVDGLYRVCIP